MIFIRLNRRLRDGVHIAHVLGTELVFRARVLDEQEVVAAALPDDDPNAERVARQLYKAGGYQVIRGDESSFTDQWVQKEAVVTEPAPAAPPGAPLEVSALLAGWRPLDLIGTGQQGDPGPAGGTSPQSGLTLAQMALCKAPEAWKESAATTYPWDHADWTPPGIGPFTPPDMPSKAPKVEAGGPEEKDPELPEAPSPAGTGAEPEASDDAPPSDDESSEDPDPASNDGEDEDEDPGDADPLAAWTGPQVDAAIAAIQAATEEAGGVVPTFRKAGFRVKAAVSGIESYTQAEHEALLELLPTPSA